LPFNTGGKVSHAALNGAAKMKRLLEKHNGKAELIQLPEGKEIANPATELASLRQEIEILKAGGRSTAPPVLISLNDACALTSLSRTALNRWRGLGQFPKAVALGDKRIAFVRQEVEQWVRERIAERGAA
jgi:predicted DNA-binding transcriptional regulator AlpA